MLLNVTQVQLQVTTVNLSLSTQGHTKEICLDSNGQDPLRRRYTTSTRHLQRYVRFVDLAQRGYMSPRRSHWGGNDRPVCPPCGERFLPWETKIPPPGYTLLPPEETFNECLSRTYERWILTSPPQVSLGTLNECVWRVYIGSELRGDKDFSSWAHGPPGGQ